MFDKDSLCWKFIYGLGIVHYELISGCKTVNKEMNSDILRRLRGVVRKERPCNGEPTVGFTFTTMLQNTGRLWLGISYQ